MTKDEELAMDLALEALEYFSDTSPTMAGKAHAEEAITTIKQARSAPVQEPVAKVVPCHTPSGNRVALHTDYQHLPIGTDLYPTPPAAQRQWIGLTQTERNDIEDYCEMMIGKPAFEAIEAKLRSKNEY